MKIHLKSRALQLNCLKPHGVFMTSKSALICVSIELKNK